MCSLTHLSPQKAPAEVLEQKDLVEANNSIARMIAHVLLYMDMHPSSNVKASWQQVYVPTLENEWTRLLLLNIFDGCAMTYKACESWSFAESDEQISSIVGEPCKQHFTGSLCEGIGCAIGKQYSDTDIMNVLQNYKAVHSNETAIVLNHAIGKTEDKNIIKPLDHETQQNIPPSTLSADDMYKSKVKVIRINTGTHPGYVELQKSTETLKLLKLTESLNHGPVIQSALEEYLLVHEFDFDNAIAVECESWPDDALIWESRPRPSEWPGPDLISKCLNTPCNIVCKSHALNPNDRYEWRYSFAKHESILLRSLPIEMKIIYIISKILLKQAVLTGDILTTYHLKTLFLWYCENHTNKDFAKNPIEVNVQCFLQFIIEHVDVHSFPNYFIPANNMISHISKTDMNLVKDQITNLLSNFIEAISTVETAKHYPFSVQGIISEMKIDSSNNTARFCKLQSNFMFAIIDHIFSFHIPNSHVMWMYCKYIPHLVIVLQNQNLHNDAYEIIQTIQTVQNTASTAYQIYDMSFVKLMILFCSLVEIKMPQISNPCRMLLNSTIQMQNNALFTSDCIADVINVIGIHDGIFATESCCLGLAELVARQKAGGTIFMLTLKKISTSLSLAKTEQECGHLLACLLTIKNVFGVPKEGVEVGMATCLRLNHSRDDLEAMTTLCGLLKDSDMNGILKHLVYAIILSLESNREEEQDKGCFEVDGKGDKSNKEYSKNKQSRSSQDSDRALAAITAISKSPQNQSGVDTFRFVSAAIFFQKITKDPQDASIVKKYLSFLRSSKISNSLKEVKELETDMEDLIRGEEVDIGSTFPFIVFYTWKCILSAGLSFTLSVLDELLQAHYNLGVLSAAGIELMVTDRLDENISVIETWIERSTIAPVQQNALLKVKMYGKLGHLYHLKALSEMDGNKRKLVMNKAFIMFRTAMKEKIKDLSVVVDYLLMLWGRKQDEFELYLEKACSDNDISQISNYFQSSEPLMQQMEDVQMEIKSRGHIKVSSFVFAHYIAISYSADAHKEGIKQAKKGNVHDHLDKMAKAVDSLNSIFKQMQEAGSDDSDQQDVIVDSSIILGFAANKLNKPDIESMAFKNVIKLNPTHKIAMKKLEQISQKSEVLYTRT